METVLVSLALLFGAIMLYQVPAVLGLGKELASLSNAKLIKFARRHTSILMIRQPGYVLCLDAFLPWRFYIQLI
jgi:hypothetical protein